MKELKVLGLGYIYIYPCSNLNIPHHKKQKENLEILLKEERGMEKKRSECAKY